MNGSKVFAMPSSSTTRGNRCRRGRPERLASEDINFLYDGCANLWSPCSNCSSSDENNSPTDLNTISWDKPALEDKSVDFIWTSANKDCEVLHEISVKNSKDSHTKGPRGYVTLRSEATKDLSGSISPKENSSRKVDEADDVIDRSDEESSRFQAQRLHRTIVNTECNNFHEASPDSYLSMRFYQNYKINRKHNISNILQADPLNRVRKNLIMYKKFYLEVLLSILPDTFEQRESSEEIVEKEKEDLKNVPWFQAGIPREIALEVLFEKPEGSFIVRDSTTKSGCYALSLRVPVEKNPNGIAHYLILHTKNGYKIKGFTKEFSSLKALITHHSVMPELLPCPLSLPRSSTRDAEHEFEVTEHKPYDVFEDIHWLMDDLEI